MASRDSRLDVLRGVAVLMVLVHHSPTPLGGWLRAGWSGVDLFFVLSGFLVSGLLFKEYLAVGRIRPFRFYVRRGFKIYPNFYVMLPVAAALQAALGPPLDPRLVLHDAVFLQNYLGPWWGHTWSLAVEEHFYLLLPPVLLLLLSSERFRRAPVRWAALLMAALGLALLAWRTRLVAGGAETDDVLFKTHLRLDSLAFGVLLSVVWHFAPERIGVVRRFRVPLLVIGLVLTVPAYVLPYEHPFLLSAGPTMLYVGYGLVLAAVLTSTRRLAGPLTPALAFVGFYSYSIYLWHLPLLFVLRWLGLPPGAPVFYFVGALAVGILVAKAVELPALKLRERWFPAGSGIAAATKEPHPALLGGAPLLRATILAVVAASAGYFLLVAAARHAGADPYLNRTWVHTDSRCYVDSATRGVDRPADRPADGGACLPGYPAAVAFVAAAFSVRPVPAGRLVSAGALLGLLLVIAYLVREVSMAQRATALPLAALVPGFVWWHAVLPLSSVTGLSLAAIALGSRGRFLAAGACGAAAALTHPAGALVAVPLAVEAARSSSASPRERALLAGAGLTVAGLAAAAVGLRSSTGQWDAWWHAIAAHGLAAGASGPGQPPIVGLHAGLTTALVALAGLLWFRHRRSSPRVDAALVAYSAAVWAFAIGAGPGMRLQLQAAALVGLVPLAARLHVAVIVVLVAASVAFGWPLSVLFFGSAMP